jgi:outer membrane immunogenic protein
MKKIFFALTVASNLLATGLANAGTADFVGPSVGINLNAQSMSNKVSGTVFGSNVSGTFGESSFGASLKGAYGVALSEKSVLSLGGTYALVDAKAGTVVVGSNTGRFVGKNAWTIYLEPGVLVADKTILFGKVGYASIKGDTEGVTSIPTNFTGSSYGIGLRSMIDKNLYVEVEALQFSFSSKVISGVTYKPSGTQANVGLGYKF